MRVLLKRALLLGVAPGFLLETTRPRGHTDVEGAGGLRVATWGPLDSEETGVFLCVSLTAIPGTRPPGAQPLLGARREATPALYPAGLWAAWERVAHVAPGQQERIADCRAALAPRCLPWLATVDSTILPPSASSVPEGDGAPPAGQRAEWGRSGSGARRRGSGCAPSFSCRAGARPHSRRRRRFGSSGGEGNPGVGGAQLFRVVWGWARPRLWSGRARAALCPLPSRGRRTPERPWTG